MQVPPGDSRALVGRNGAGKSTLVGVLTGIISPDAGRVRFSGEDAPEIAEPQKWQVGAWNSTSSRNVRGSRSSSDRLSKSPGR
jgi:ABC-type multidrug transport system ATPase subunit